MNILEQARQLVCDMNPHEAEKHRMRTLPIQSWPQWAQRDFKLACEFASAARSTAPTITSDILWLLSDLYEMEDFYRQPGADARLARVLEGKEEEVRIIVEGIRAAGHTHTAKYIENMASTFTKASALIRKTNEHPTAR